MIFRSLSLQGIGPFRKHFVIDFDALAERGLFLLDGPTGSGKSTIIDAITWALYGRTAADKNEVQRIRSTHALPNEESFVDLVFTVGTGTYRVRRTPSYEGASKQRGGKLVERKTTAKLWRLSEAAVEERDWDAGEVLAAKPADVGFEMGQILGIDFKQFTQTVVLPQGEFAKFLKLSSSEREPLLTALFGTHRYRDFTDALKNHAGKSREAIHEAHQTLMFHAQTWQEKFGDDESAALTDSLGLSTFATHDGADAELLARAALAQERLQEFSSAQEQAASLAEEAEETARVHCQTIERLQELNSKRSKLREQLAQLLQRQDEVTGLERIVARAQESELPRSRLSDLQSSLEALTATADDLLETTRASVPEQWLELTLMPTWQPATLAGALDEISTQAQEQERDAAARHEKLVVTLANLEATQDAERKLGELRTRLAENAQLTEQDRAELADLAAASEQLPELIAAAQRQCDESRAAQGTIEHLAQKRETIRRKLQLRDELHSLDGQLREVQDLIEVAATKYQAALARQQTVTQDWIRDTAPQLARELHPGTPCPVCGSLEHPNPAHSDGSTTTREDVDAAQQEAVERHEELRTHDVQKSALQSKREALALQLSPDDTREVLTSELAAVQTELDQAQILADAGEQREQLLVQLEQQRATLSERRELLEETLTKRNATDELTRERIDDLEAQLAPLRLEYPDFPSALAQARLQDEAALRHQRQALEIDERVQQAHQRLAAANTSLDNSTFATPSEVYAAALDREQLVAFQHDISEYRAQLAHVEQSLNDREITAARELREGELEIAQEAFSQAQIARKTATQQAHDARINAHASSQQLELLRGASEKWHAELKSAGPTLRLASLASADASSPGNTPLHMWVLFHQFEQVVQRANQHLANISGGRYELLRSADESNSRIRGLALQVVDRDGSEQGDVVRSTSSLSGGETFYTSLSLALALAEIVQEENGGTRIETLLIDEGFGTLSDDVRDCVMSTLETLRQHDRMVGVVSHVPELKDAIRARIAVRPTPRGDSEITVYYD